MWSEKWIQYIKELSDEVHIIYQIDTFNIFQKFDYRWIHFMYCFHCLLPLYLGIASLFEAQIWTERVIWLLEQIKMLFKKRKCHWQKKFCFNQLNWILLIIILVFQSGHPIDLKSIRIVIRIRIHKVMCRQYNKQSCQQF